MHHLNPPLLLALMATISLIGCQSTQQSGPKIIKPTQPIEKPSKADYSDMYVRGTFNWWGVNEAHRLKRIGHQLYRAQLELVADGQYYEFVFADVDYTFGKNCGFNKLSQSIVTSTGSAMPANCKVSSSYFKFKPDQSTSYYFYFDHTEEQPKVYIRKAH